MSVYFPFSGYSLLYNIINGAVGVCVYVCMHVKFLECLISTARRQRQFVDEHSVILDKINLVFV